MGKKGTHGFQAPVSSTGDTISKFSVLNRVCFLDGKPLKECKGLFQKLYICGTKNSFQKKCNSMPSFSSNNYCFII